MSFLKELEKYDMSDFKPKKMLLGKKEPRKIESLMNSTLIKSEVKDSIKANNKFTSATAKNLPEFKHKVLRPKALLTNSKKTCAVEFVSVPYDESSYDHDTYNFKTENSPTRRTKPNTTNPGPRTDNARFNKNYRSMTKSDLLNTQKLAGLSFDDSYNGKKNAFDKNIPLNNYLKISPNEILTPSGKLNLNKQNFRNVVTLGPVLQFTEPIQGHRRPER